MVLHREIFLMLYPGTNPIWSGHKNGEIHCWICAHNVFFKISSVTVPKWGLSSLSLLLSFVCAILFGCQGYIHLLQWTRFTPNKRTLPHHFISNRIPWIISISLPWFIFTLSTYHTQAPIYLLICLLFTTNSQPWLYLHEGRSLAHCGIP